MPSDSARDKGGESGGAHEGGSTAATASDSAVPPISHAQAADSETRVLPAKGATDFVARRLADVVESWHPRHRTDEMDPARQTIGGPPPIGADGDSIHGVDLTSAPTLLPAVKVPSHPKVQEDPEAPTEGFTGSERRGRYRLGRTLGRGGFGEVLQALQLALGRHVAVKRPLQIPPQPPDATPWDIEHYRGLEALFYNEALLTANLTHPNIVPVYDMTKGADGRHLLAMKLVDGREWTLALELDAESMGREAYLAKHIQILTQVAQAVAYAHAKGIVHRDLKPQQVMLGDYGEVLLMDWGIAVVFDKSLLPEETVRAFGAMLPVVEEAGSPAGTPAYMAPEQTLPDSREIGPWTDVYLLGALLYEILTGDSPHPAVRGIKDIKRIRDEPVIPPREAAPDRFVPPDLEELAMRSLSIDKAQRPASVRAFIDSLQEHLTGAHRRRESLAITERVAKGIEDSRGDYREHSHNLALLTTAEAMWPENSLVPELRERILDAYIRDATANRDFVLARLLLDSMPEGNTRTTMAHDLDRAIGQFKAARKQRERVVLLLVLLVSALVVWGIVRDRRMSGRIAELEHLVPRHEANR